MQTIETASDVIDALGGTTATAKLTGRSLQAVSNWRATGRLPRDTVFLLKSALESHGKSAPVTLWGMPDLEKSEAAS